jgi:hypothetical protein
MAKAAAKSPPKQGALKPAKPKGKGGGTLMTVTLMGALAMLAALPLCMIVVPGMMPTIAVWFIDRQRPRYLAYTVGIMNAAGVFPFVLLVAVHLSITTAAAKLADPLTWMVMYGAAAVGWLLCLATPTVAKGCIELQMAQKRRTLDSLSKAIREEWGPEVSETTKR